MKKTVVTTVLIILVAALSLSLSGCGFLGGLLDGGGGDNITFEYDADYVAEHLTGDYAITYKVTAYETGAAPAVSNQKIIRTSTGYYFETSGTEEGQTESKKELFIKMGDDYYLFEYDAAEDRYIRASSTVYSKDTMELYASAYFGYLTMYAGATGLESDGTETIAGKTCEKYKYSVSILGMAGMSYHYSIDKDTGVCLKYAMDVSAGGEKSGFEFLCTEFNTTSAAMPEYVLEQTAPEKVASITATAGDGQVTLSWTAGYNGGSAITSYEVTMDNWATKVTKTASQLTHTFTGLTNGTPYTFKVRAVNAIGTGADVAKSATPTGSGTTDPDGDENNYDGTYTLPTNLNLTYTVTDDGYTHSRTIIKIGNSFYSEYRDGNGTLLDSNSYFLKDNGDNTWTYYDYASGWRASDTPWTDLTRIGGIESSFFYWHILNESEFLHMYEKIGTSTVLGREVDILEFFNTTCYADPTTGMILKYEYSDNWSEITLQVTEYDTSITNFSAASITVPA